MNVGSMWWLAGLVMLSWLVVILSVAWLDATRSGGRANVPTARAREILADRYAGGEIGLEEYRERLGATRDQELTRR